MDFISAAQQVVGASPAPSYTPTPGYPPPVSVVGTHTAGACGCGGSHAPAAVAPSVAAPAPTLAPPRFLQASMLQTPADFKPPPLAGDFAMFDFSNWRADWWKYIAGALLYKLLRD